MARKSKIVFVLLIWVSTVCGQYLTKPTYQNIKYLTNISVFQQQLDDIFNDQNFSSSIISVYIKSLDNAEVLYSLNREKLVTPASDMKLFTTSAALMLLKPDYIYETQIFTDGKIYANKLQGNLIIQGCGDPSISERFCNGNPLEIFNKWADSLSKLGIEVITGNLIGDDNLFDDNMLGQGWETDYESEWFSAPISALSFNDNCIKLEVKPSVNGKNAFVKALPETKYVTIINETKTVLQGSARTIGAKRIKGTNVIKVFGQIPEGDNPYEIDVTINNPTQYFMVVLKDVLKSKGIEVLGYPVDIDDEGSLPDYNKCKKLFTHYSPKLSDIIRETNKFSFNLYAELLVKTIGLKYDGYGTTANGIKNIKQLMLTMGINPENLYFADGSGLSRLNLTTSEQIVDALAYMKKQDYFNLFLNSLPVAGVDGTLANRFNRTKAEAKIYAKPGYNIGARALSGYAYTLDNELFAFSIIINNFLVPYTLADKVLDEACLRLVTFTRK